MPFLIIPFIDRFDNSSFAYDLSGIVECRGRSSGLTPLFQSTPFVQIGQVHYAGFFFKKKILQGKDFKKAIKRYLRFYE